MSALMTFDAIVRDVAFLRGKPADTNDGSAAASTATGAVAINGTPIWGGYTVPSYEIGNPPRGREYMVGANAQNPGRLPGNWIPHGWVARYPDDGLLVQAGDAEIVVDGELVPMALSTTRYLVGLVCDQDFNVNVGGSAVDEPSENAFYAGKVTYFFYAGYGTGVTHMNLISSSAMNYSWWHAGGGGPIL